MNRSREGNCRRAFVSRHLPTFQRKFDGYKRSKTFPLGSLALVPASFMLRLLPWRSSSVGSGGNDRTLFFSLLSYPLFFRSSLYPFVPETTLFMPNEHVGERRSFHPRLDNFSAFFPSLLPLFAFVLPFFAFFSNPIFLSLSLTCTFHSKTHANQGPR